MKPSPSPEYDENDRELIELLKDLGSFRSTYPSELLAARRAAFLARVEQVSQVEPGEELSAEERELVRLFEHLKSAPVEYPEHLLAARRSAFLRQMEQARGTSVWEEIRRSLQRIFQTQGTSPALPGAGFLRLSLVIASLVAAVMIGSLFVRTESAVAPAPLQAVASPKPVLPTSTGEATILVCQPENPTSSCPPGELDSSQDLADPGNGSARPAVSKDAHGAAYVNDGRSGESWVSYSPESWIKLDLGKVITINTVSIQKGNPGRSGDGDAGQFVISVAQTDMYADGDSNNDYVEYTQVFRSEQAGFRGTGSPAETIQIQFPTVQARFVKITFEKVGAAVEEIDVFLVSPPMLADEPTGTPQAPTSDPTLTPRGTNTPSLMDTATSVPGVTQLPTGTAIPTLTNTPPPSDTPIPLPTNTVPPVETPTPVPVPTEPLPTMPPTIPPSPVSTEPIVVTGHDQTLTFTCNGNAAEIRGHANTVTLLGSCSSITVTGNRNHVYWQFGSPVITNRGKDNLIEQL